MTKHEQVVRLTPRQLRDYVREAVEHAFDATFQQQVQAALAPLVTEPVTNTAGPLHNPENKMEKRLEEKGLDAARLVRCLAAGRGDTAKARAFAEHEYGASHVVTKALAAGDGAAGGFLVPETMSSELIDLLRPRSIVRAAGPTVVRPARGSMDFPKLTSGASASYVGENQDITVSEQQFGQVALSAKKLAALVPISNDLLRFGMDVDTVVRDDLVQAIATTEDVNLLRGDGLQDKPKGLRNWAAAANVTASNGTTATNIEADFKELLNAIESADVPLLRPRWLMAPRSKNHLVTLRDANGNLIYPEIRSDNPTIHGWPVLVSTNIPTNLGGGTETEIYFVDFAEVVFGEVNAVEIDVSADATYTTTGGATVSAFQRDQTLMRAILRHDLVVKHDVAIAVKTGVTWGA